MRREIKNKLLDVHEFVKTTELSYPHRASILGFLGAALTVNATTADVLSPVLDSELRAHLRDALKPLGFAVKRIQKNRSPKESGEAFRVPPEGP